MAARSQMEELAKHHGLLAALDAMSASIREGSLGPPVDADPADEDSEAEHWADLVMGADGALLQHARLRMCMNGLAAVERYLAERDRGGRNDA